MILYDSNIFQGITRYHFLIPYGKIYGGRFWVTQEPFHCPSSHGGVSIKFDARNSEGSRENSLRWQAENMMRRFFAVLTCFKWFCLQSAKEI